MNILCRNEQRERANEPVQRVSDQIAQREAEVEKVVLQARQGSDRRVRATSGRYSAENELEEALLELTVRTNDSLATFVLGECTQSEEL